MLSSYPAWYRRVCTVWLFTGLPLLVIIIAYAAATGGLGHDAPVDFSFYSSAPLGQVVIAVLGMALILFGLFAPLLLYPFAHRAKDDDGFR